jgi:hypothetical protein
MLAKIFVMLSEWFLLSMIVGLLLGRAISTFRKAPAPGIAPLETDWGAALNELEEKEMLVPSHVRMQQADDLTQHGGVLV